MLLGEGAEIALSPDEKWVIAQTQQSPAQLNLLPTGDRKPLTHHAINHAWARWFPDGKRVLFSGNEPDRGVRLYVQDVEGGRRERSRPRACTPAPSWFLPMGSRSRASVRTNWATSIPLREAMAARFAVWNPENNPSHGREDGLSLFIYRPAELPAKVSRLELATGRKTALEQLMRGDPAGVETTGPILLTLDGKTGVYGYHRMLSDLYLGEGLK